MKGRLAIVVAALCGICGPAEAAESPLAPLLFDEAYLVARVDLEKVRIEPLCAALEPMAAVAALPSERATISFVTALRQAGGRELYLVWGRSTGILFVPLVEGANSNAIKTAVVASPIGRYMSLEAADDFAGGVVAGRRSMLLYLKNLKAKERPELARALEATAGSTLQVLLLPGDANRLTAASVKWPTLAYGATSEVVKEMAWGSIGIDGPPLARCKIVFAARDATGAQKLEAAVGRAIEPMLTDPTVRKNVALIENLRAVLRWQRAAETVSLDLDDQEGRLTMVARGMIRPVLEAELSEGALAKSTNQFKQIAIAMHNHHDVHKRFPAPAILDKDGKPLLSWRVTILPFLEGHALYKRFRLDEPWDSPHNITLLDEMPDVYRCPLARVADGHTVYLAPRGEGTMFEGPNGTAIRQIIDGTSKTIAFVEANDAHAVPWTSPDDWPYNPDEPVAGLGGHFPDEFLAAGCDGAIHRIKLSIDPEIMRSLISYAGREPVAFPD